MTDILKTMTDDERDTAIDASKGEDQFAADCWQLRRYYHGLIFIRTEAERALRMIRDGKE